MSCILHLPATYPTTSPWGEEQETKGSEQQSPTSFSSVNCHEKAITAAGLQKIAGDILIAPSAGMALLCSQQLAQPVLKKQLGRTQQRWEKGALGSLSTLSFKEDIVFMFRAKIKPLLFEATTHTTWFNFLLETGGKALWKLWLQRPLTKSSFSLLQVQGVDVPSERLYVGCLSILTHPSCAYKCSQRLLLRTWWMGSIVRFSLHHRTGKKENSPATSTKVIWISRPASNQQPALRTVVFFLGGGWIDSGE